MEQESSTNSEDDAEQGAKAPRQMEIKKLKGNKQNTLDRQNPNDFFYQYKWIKLTTKEENKLFTILKY